MTASTATKKPAVRNKSTLTIGEDYIEGTIADILGRGQPRLRINSKVATQPDLSTLQRLGIAKTIGTAERAEGTRGPKPTIIRIPTIIPGMVVARK